jgi:ribose transport system permease protein
MERVQMKNRSYQVKELLLNYFSFIGLAMVAVLFHILTKGKLFGSRNIMNIFNNFYTIGLAAMAYTFVMALGELDLSVGAILGISAALGAFAGKIDTMLILPVCILTGFLVGYLNGFCIAKLNTASFIGTLAVSFIMRGLTTWFLNGSIGIDISMRIFDQNWVKITTFCVLMVVFYFLYEHFTFGKHCRAVGASKPAAQQSGIRVSRTRLLAFVIVGGVCGLVGFFTLVRAFTASSSTGSAFEFDVLLAVLFGGMPLSGGWPVRFRSALIGAVTMAILKSGMSLVGLDGLTQAVVKGLILIAVVSISFDRKNAGVIK